MSSAIDGSNSHNMPARATDSLIEQGPSRRLLARALELVGPTELGLEVIERLALDEAGDGGHCRVEHLEALLDELRGAPDEHRHRNGSSDARARP